MEPLTASIICVILMIALLILGLPIPYALGFSSMLIGLVTFGPAALAKAGWATFSQLYSLIWTPLPLFVLMGSILSQTRIGEDLYHAARNWLSRLPGGLIIASVWGEALVSAALGASTATLLVAGKVAVPEFERYKYNKPFSVGALLAGGALGPLIPPSAVFVIFSILSNAPLGRLLTAGIIPGILLTLMLTMIPLIMCSRNRSIAPGVSGVSWKERFVSIKFIWPVILVFAALMGSIYFGIATPTEATGVASVVLIIIAVAFFGLRFKGLFYAGIDASLTNAMLMFIFIGAGFFSYVVGSSALAEHLANLANSVEVQPILIVICIMVIILVLGVFLDGVTIMMLTVPIFVPLIKSLGFDPIWFGVIFVVNTEIGLLTPPMAINFFLASSTFKVPTGELMRGMIPFLICLVIFMAVLVAFPEIVLWLPSTMVTK
ncbi:MAG: TRAP transporter large permease [Dehalococcoidia bacterium]|jgi:tripartite ATP-independent transporter DctM subunit